MSSPLDALAGTFDPPKVSVLYRAGLVVVAIAMILLPAIYIGLILLSAWAVFFHFTQNTWILSGEGNGLWQGVAYLAPGVAGATLVFFMVKPFFAKQQEEASPVTLDAANEPLFFAFVARICELVGAPMPSRIDVDLQANASARLRRGLLSRDLVLTVGLPLAAGLDVRQFGGVLAHEFGHFAQGAGMRLTYVIRWTNAWFARVVYERDEWDARLTRWSKAVDIRLGAVLYAARGAVWVTRRILWVLMHAGHAISCFMLRQMEFDADACEAKLAGSEAFAATSSRLRRLNAARFMAFHEAGQSWLSRRLPEDLPSLVAHQAEVLEASPVEDAAESTGWFDTHPSDAERREAAAALNERGILHSTEPATILFNDFSAICKTATRHHYQHEARLEFTDHHLVSSDVIIAESRTNNAAAEAARRFYGKVPPALVHLGRLVVDVPAVEYWTAAKMAADASGAAAEAAAEVWVAKQTRIATLTAARALQDAGFVIDPKEFDLGPIMVDQREAVLSALAETERMAAAELARMEPFAGALRKRIATSLALNSSAKPDTLAVLAVLEGVLPLLYDLQPRLRAIVTLAYALGDQNTRPAVEAQLSKQGADVTARVKKILDHLGEEPYPFHHPEGRLTIAAYARYEKQLEYDWQQAHQVADTLYDRLMDLHRRVLGSVLVAADEAERQLDTMIV